jgi:serine/threonine-protein kinase
LLLAPGTVLAEKYRVDRLLGEGGMGVVVAATHLQLQQQIAVKLLRPEAMANPSLIERFEREARAAARVHGEHVARVIDVGKLPGGLPYIVMEYLEGEDLERKLTRVGALPIAEAIDYMLQTCEAVGEAHAANIVHRDLKPANLFLAMRPNEDAPCLKVLDFGISKILEPETDAITKTSAMMGTAYYMSPEQLTSAKKVDTRTDVWALGVILYELLAGKRPFEAGTMPEVVAMILENTPVPLKELRPDVPDELCDVVSLCLRKMDQRLPTVADLATALAPFAPPHAVPLVARINKLVTAAGRPRAPITIPPDQLRIAVDPQAMSQGATIVMGVTQSRTDPDPAPPSHALPPKAKPSSARYVLGGLAVLVLGGGGYLSARAFKSPRPDTDAHALVGAMTTTASSASAAPSVGVAPSASAVPSAAPSSSVSLAVPAASSASRLHGGPATRSSAQGVAGSGQQTNVPPVTAPSSSAAKDPLHMGIQ